MSAEMGRIPPHPPVFSYELQTKELQDTELGRGYGRWEAERQPQRPQRLGGTERS